VPDWQSGVSGRKKNDWKESDEGNTPRLIATTLPGVKQKYPIQLYSGGIKQISNNLHGP